MTTKNTQDVMVELKKEFIETECEEMEGEENRYSVYENDGELVADWWVDKITQLVEEVEAGAFEEAIKLSDEIERAEPDGGTRQWMAFKRFRNTLRDRLTHTTSDVIEK